MVNLQQLKQSSIAELEAIYAEPRPALVPDGNFRGTHLLRLDAPGHRRRLYTASAGFAWVPFGVDFDHRCWTFVNRRLRIGRFLARPGPSRWRDASVIQLHYSVSRLPRLVRDVLYDEVKPLSDELCLGIGGINVHTGRGEHFFFALERMR